MSVPYETMSAFARDTANRLHMQPHPEGGWYIQDWQSEHTDTSSGRPLSSLIYFLLPEGDASAWHMIDADEIWLWHGPATVTLQLGGYGEAPTPDTECDSVILGGGIVGGAAETASQPVGHVIVPAGCWQRTVAGKGDALVSCVVSPGFVFEQFKLV